MRRASRFAWVLLSLSAVLLAQPAGLVPSVRRAAMARDLATAERLVAPYRVAVFQPTPRSLEAISWAGRGASFAREWDKAETFAREVYEASQQLLRSRKLDFEPSLPLALGAAIEVLATTEAARGDRSGVVSFLQGELARYKETSIATRIQKNIHLLSLEGKPAPPIASAQWIGARQKTLAELKGKVVLAFFWAHWCGDCKSQMPALERLAAQYGSRGLTILGPTQLYGYITRGENATPEQEMAYLRGAYQQAHPIPVWMGVPVSSENFLNFGVSTTPTLMLVDPQGIVRLYHPGTLSYEALAAKIEPLLPNT